MDTNEAPCLQLAGRFFRFQIFSGAAWMYGRKALFFIILVVAASLGVELPP